MHDSVSEAQANSTPAVLTLFFTLLTARWLLLLQGFSLSYRNGEGKREREVAQQSHTYASLTRAASSLGLKKSGLIK